MAPLAKNFQTSTKIIPPKRIVREEITVKGYLNFYEGSIVLHTDKAAADANTRTTRLGSAPGTVTYIAEREVDA